MVLVILSDFLGWCFLWSCVAVADYSADHHFRKLKKQLALAHAQERSEKCEDDDEKGVEEYKAGEYGKLLNEFKSLLPALWGKGCKKVKYGGDFYFMAVSYPIYAVANIGLESLIDDYEKFDNIVKSGSVPVKRRLVNMKVSFHFIMACSWILLYGWDKSFNFWNYEPSVPLYNITCFSAAVCWFLLLLIETVSTPATALHVPPIEDTILYNLGYMDQSFWSGIYVLTSFYPFGAYTCYSSLWWLIGIPKDYINAARKVYNRHPVSLVAFIINMLNPLIAIPMALLFLMTRYGQVWEQTVILYNKISWMMERNQDSIEKISTYLGALPDYVQKELKKLDQNLNKFGKVKTSAKRA